MDKNMSEEISSILSSTFEWSKKVINIKESSMQCDRIYHYTSPNGLMAILQNKSLRFSDSKFLNDKSEVQLLPKLILNQIEEIEEKQDIIHILKLCCLIFLEENVESKMDKKFIEKFENETGMKLTALSTSKVVRDSMSVYILSLTKNADSLPMWNYYCKTTDKTGYNIEIDSQEIVQYFNTISKSEVYIEFGNVLYDDVVQSDIARMFIDEVKRWDAEGKFRLGDDNLLIAVVSSLMVRICIIAPFIKRKEFSNEEEVRFAMTCIGKNLKETLKTHKIEYMTEVFSINSGIFIPHAEVKINTFEKCIKSITTSPYGTELHVKGVKDLLRANDIDIDKVSVNPSKCPVRY